MSGCYSVQVRVIARTAAVSLLALLGVGATSLLAPSEAAGEDAVVLDRIVAVVNNQILLESDLDLWMVYDETIGAELQKLQNPTEEQLLRRFVELRPQGLDELIARTLLLGQAPQFNIAASESEVEAYLQNLARNAGLGGVPELKHAVEESMRYGTWAQYRYKLREDIIIYQLEAMLINVAVSDQQVLDRYRALSKSEEAKLEVRRFVFRASDNPAERDAVFKQAKAVVRRLSAGEDPEALAQELEQEVDSEEIGRSSVSRPIGERLFAAKAGDVVGPLESGQGYLVFLIDDVITSDVLGFDEAKEQLRAMILDEVRDKGRSDLRQQLRARAHVDIRL